MHRSIALLALAACATPDPVQPQPQRAAPQRANLDVPYLVAGRTHVLPLRDAPPNSLLRLYGTARPPGPPACFSFFGGDCMDLPGPFSGLILLGSGTSDGDGNADFTVRVPANPPPTASLQVAGLDNGAFWVSTVATPTFLSAAGDLDDDNLIDSREFDEGTDPADPDSDDDGLVDGLEVNNLGTDPLVADSDGGGATDGEELVNGTDPLDPGDDTVVVPPVCDAVRDLNLEGDFDGTAYTLTATTGLDELDASCQGSSPGGDVAITFTAPSADTWRISTAGSSVGTTLSVWDGCGTAERACHDPFLPAGTGELWVDLAASETVTIVVERDAGLLAADVQLTVRPEPQPEPPVLDSLELVCGVDDLGVRATVTETDHPVVGATLTTTDAAGLSTETRHTVLTLPWTYAAPLDGTTDVSVTLEDAAGQRVSGTANCVATPVRALGDSCDPDGVFDTCGEGVCDDGTCATRGAPTLATLSASVNEDLGRVGVQVLGTDPDGDAASIVLTPLDAALQPLHPDLAADLDVFGNDPFVGVVVAQLPLTLPSRDLHAVRVSVVDATGLASAPLTVIVDDPTPLFDGDTCDPTETFGLCPADCVPDTAEPGGTASCGLAEVACPAAWPSPSFTELDPETWQLVGTTAGADWQTPAGTCGGAGPQVVATFVPTRSGFHRVQLTPDTLGAFGVLVARSHCASPSSDREALCTTGTSSRLVDLAAGVPVHFVVAGDSPLTVDGSLGGFTLTVTLEP
jgi:hypothetical protein